jgi:hypothetical protein
MKQYEPSGQYDYTYHPGGTVTRLYEIKTVKAIDARNYIGHSIIQGGIMTPIYRTQTFFPSSGNVCTKIEINGQEIPPDSLVMVAIEHKPEPNPTPEPVKMSDSQIIREAKRVAEDRFHRSDCNTTDEDLWSMAYSALRALIREGYE